MPTLSPLQTLPLHAVELVVNYVVGSSYMQLVRTTRHGPTSEQLLQPFLCLCRSFRAVVQPRIFNRYVLDLSAQSYRDGIHNSHQSSRLRHSSSSNSPNVHILAKNLDVNVDLICVCSGWALDMLSCAPYNDYVFSSARQLTFIFNSNKRAEESVMDSAVVEANIVAFKHRLRQMTPRVHKLLISNDHAAEWSQLCTSRFGGLVGQLLQLADHFEYKFEEPAQPVISEFDGICNLVHIDYTIGRGSEHFYQLARQCAQSLQSLKLQTFWNSHELMGVTGLIQHPSSGYVEYPSLQRLKLKISCNAEALRQPAFLGAVPFPALRDLYIQGEYPFGDDTPFRGNAATLKCLYLELSPALANALKRHQVFTHASHRQLRHVSLHRSHGMVPNCFATCADYIEFVLGIGPAASTRVISGMAFDIVTPRMLSAISEHASIQNLELKRARFALWDVIHLIRSLPLLSSLDTAIPLLGTLPVGVSMDRLSHHVVEHYAPLGQRFQSWTIAIAERVTSETVECVLLLALACPRFNYVTPNLLFMRPFVKLMKELIASSAYTPYERRLQRLVDLQI